MQMDKEDTQRSSLNSIYLSVTPVLRWLTTVFLSLSSVRYDCLPDVSIKRTCKNGVRNHKKKLKPLQRLKGVKSLRYT